MAKKWWPKPKPHPDAKPRCESVGTNGARCELPHRHPGHHFAEGDVWQNPQRVETGRYRKCPGCGVWLGRRAVIPWHWCTDWAKAVELWGKK